MAGQCGAKLKQYIWCRYLWRWSGLWSQMHQIYLLDGS